MTYAIAVVQRKGGVGKTTLAVCIAAELLRRGKAVGLIDADPQESSAQWAEPGNLQIPVHKITPADQSIDDWIRKHDRIAANYNCVVVDTAPNERAVVASAAVSDLVLVPCTPSGLDLHATGRTLEIIKDIRPRCNRQPKLTIVPNRVDARTLEGQQLVEELHSFGEIVGPMVGSRSVFVRAFSTGYSVDNMPEGRAAHREIEELCDLVEVYLGSKRHWLRRFSRSRDLHY